MSTALQVGVHRASNDEENYRYRNNTHYTLIYLLKPQNKTKRLLKCGYFNVLHAERVSMPWHADVRITHHDTSIICSIEMKLENSLNAKANRMIAKKSLNNTFRSNDFQC